MAYRTSVYSAGVREFLRQLQRLSRPGLVKTWRVWDGTPGSDDEISEAQCPAVRVTMAGVQASLSSTSDDSATFVQDTRLTLAIETWVAGYDQFASADLWGELRDAIFSQDESVRADRTGLLAAAGVLDVTEGVPVLPGGPESIAQGIAYARGSVTLWVETGA